LGVVEAIQHFFCHELFTSLRLSDRRFDRANLAVESVFLLLQPAQVGEQGIRVAALPREHLPDGGQAEAEFPQQQDALQPGQGIRVVIAVAVAADPAWTQQPQLAVVAEGSGCRAGQPRNVLYRPVHLAFHLPFLFGPRLPRAMSSR
jgi:hypothetical protein